jgi:hypothetical protein
LKSRFPICVDCRNPCFAHHHFVVRSAVWAEAGMNGWATGYLHQTCLEKRLGRKLKKRDELLVWFDKRKRGGGCIFALSPDYLTSAEYLEHCGEDGAAE